jgi:hypothetical protein
MATPSTDTKAIVTTFIFIGEAECSSKEQIQTKTTILPKDKV